MEAINRGIGIGIVVLVTIIAVTFGAKLYQESFYIEKLEFVSPVTGDVDYKPNEAGAIPVVVSALGIGQNADLPNTFIVLRINEGEAESYEAKVPYSGQGQYRWSIPRIGIPARGGAQYTFSARLDLNGRVFSSTAILTRREPGPVQVVSAELKNFGIEIGDAGILAGFYFAGGILLTLLFKVQNERLRMVPFVAGTIIAMFTYLSSTIGGVIALIVSAFVAIIAILVMGGFRYERRTRDSYTGIGAGRGVEQKPALPPHGCAILPDGSVVRLADVNRAMLSDGREI